MSTPTSSTLNGDSKGQPRTPIGRPLADNPSTLAAAAPAKLTADTGSPAVICGTQNTQVRSVVVKQTDHLTLAGSNPGDHRAPALAADITAFAKNSPNPRENVGQFPLSARTPAAPAPITTVDSENVGG